MYKEYHSVCSLVGIGTLPTPLSPASGPLPQNWEGGHTRLRVRGWGSPNSDDWRKNLPLCPLCNVSYPWQRYCTVQCTYGRLKFLLHLNRRCTKRMAHRFAKDAIAIIVFYQATSVCHMAGLKGSSPPSPPNTSLRSMKSIQYCTYVLISVRAITFYFATHQLGAKPNGKQPVLKEIS